MAIEFGTLTQTSTYGGLLGWDAFTEIYSGHARPALEIPLYLKEHPIPQRKPKVTEISSIPLLDHAGWDGGASTLFWGSPEPLSVAISGWLITPKSGNTWNPKDKNGNALSWGNINYADIISGMIEGRLNRSATGAWIRRDPDYYIDSYGRKYPRPVIIAWEPTYSPIMKKQSFSATIYLEQ